MLLAPRNRSYWSCQKAVKQPLYPKRWVLQSYPCDSVRPFFEIFLILAFQNDADLLAFQEELEEDEEARKNVNIYRDPNKNLDSDCEEDIPRIDLAEMMEMVDLNKNDEEMPDLEG